MVLLHAEDGAAAPAPPPGLVRAAVSFAGATEPPRREWFLAGTEPPAAPQALAPRRPRIVAPGPGTVLALDPDVPPELQRVVLAAEGARPGARWRLDGRDAGEARGLRPWPPAPGRHRLALVGADGRVLDEVAFEVRGAVAP
jgi:penicillin-binding protein 1C